MQDSQVKCYSLFAIKVIIGAMSLQMMNGALLANQRTEQLDKERNNSKARANAFLDAVKDIMSLSDFEKDDIIDYVAHALAEDKMIHPDREDRDRIRFAQGKSVKQRFDLPFMTGRFYRDEANSSFWISVLPLSNRAVLLQFNGYELRNNNIITCDLAARATIDSSGVLRGRSVHEDDETKIEGRIGRKGRSLKVQINDPSDNRPGCGFGASLDGTYVAAGSRK